MYRQPQYTKAEFNFVHAAQFRASGQKMRLSSRFDYIGGVLFCLSCFSLLYSIHGRVLAKREAGEDADDQELPAGK